MTVISPAASAGIWQSEETGAMGTLSTSSPPSFKQNGSNFYTYGYWGMGFYNVPIPKNCIISAATITFSIFYDGKGAPATVDMNVEADVAVNAAVLATSSYNLSNRSRRSIYSQKTLTNSSTTNNVLDITSGIKPNIEDPLWASGNNLVLMLVNPGPRGSSSGATTVSPKSLSITYTPAGPSVSLWNGSSEIIGCTPSFFDGSTEKTVTLEIAP